MRSTSRAGLFLILNDGVHVAESRTAVGNNAAFWLCWTWWDCA